MSNLVNTKIDKMRYQTNKLSFSLTLLSLVFYLTATFFAITYDSFGQKFTGPQGDETNFRVESDMMVGISIAVTIVLVLFIFLAAEKQKAYHKKWGWGTIILGFIIWGTFLVLPIRLYNNLGPINGKPQLTTQILITILVCTVLAGICLIVSGIVCAKKSTALYKHLREIDI